MDTTEKKTEKLGFYLSFKKTERELYEKVKSTPNYTTLIKDLLRNYYEKGENLEQDLTPNNTMLVTFEDICKLVASVNKVNIIESNNNLNEDKRYNESVDSKIPEDMINGL